MTLWDRLHNAFVRLNDRPTISLFMQMIAEDVEFEELNDNKYGVVKTIH